MGKQTTDITIFHYENNQYTKNVYHGCFWEEDQSANIKKSGLSNVDSLYISVPWTDAGFAITKGKDYVIRGQTQLGIDNKSQESQSMSLNAIKATYNVFTLTAISEKTHGSRKMWHWELSGK